MSATAAATCGFVSFLMPLSAELPAMRYRDLLIETSHPRTYNGLAPFEHVEAPHAVAVCKARESTQSNAAEPHRKPHQVQNWPTFPHYLRHPNTKTCRPHAT